MDPRPPPRLLRLNSNSSLSSSSRQQPLGPQGDSGSSSHHPAGESTSEQQQQAFMGCSKIEEELSCAAAAAEADLPGGTSASFAQWLSKLDVLEALRQVLQDGASVCLNSSRKVDAMLILKERRQQATNDPPTPRQPQTHLQPPACVFATRMQPPSTPAMQPMN
ncbi:hypothetical protein Esti_003340 [Eimeria stiedai]